MTNQPRLLLWSGRRRARRCWSRRRRGPGSCSRKQGLGRVLHAAHSRVAHWAVGELPLVVVVLLLVNENGLLGAGRREADNARAAKSLTRDGIGARNLAPAGARIGIGRVAGVSGVRIAGVGVRVCRGVQAGVGVGAA